MLNDNNNESFQIYGDSCGDKTKRCSKDKKNINKKC